MITNKKMLMTALMVLLLPLALASCTTTDDATPQLLPGNPSIPGTASPEGGDQPGVSISLTQPRITIGGINAEAKAGTRAATIDPEADAIHLYVDLMDKDEKVKQSCYYTYYPHTQWELSSVAPLMVHGGTGLYYMRVAAYIEGKDRKELRVCYSGTAIVAADGTFTFTDNLKPYTSQVTIELKGADGNELTDADDYMVVLRGMVKTDWRFKDDDNNVVSWTGTGNISHPEYNAAGDYYDSDDNYHNNGIFYDIIPGTVPAKWYNGADGYNTPGPIESYATTQLGSDEILFSIYKKPANGSGFTYDDVTGFPKNASAEYHVKIAADKKYTLEAGKSYSFTLKLNADKTFHIEKFNDITVGDFGEGGNIEIGK